MTRRCTCLTSTVPQTLIAVEFPTALYRSFLSHCLSALSFLAPDSDPSPFVAFALCRHRLQSSLALFSAAQPYWSFMIK